MSGFCSTARSGDDGQQRASRDMRTLVLLQRMSHRASTTQLRDPQGAGPPTLPGPPNPSSAAGFLWGLSPTPTLSGKFEAVHTDFQRSIVSLPVRERNEKRDGEKEVKPWPPRPSLTEGLARGESGYARSEGRGARGGGARGGGGGGALRRREEVCPFSRNASMPGRREPDGARGPRGQLGRRGAGNPSAYLPLPA